MAYKLYRTTDTYKEMVNMETGAVKKVPFASDRQFQYLQKLRAEIGKAPLKNRPTVFAATKAIDKILKTQMQQKLF